MNNSKLIIENFKALLKEYKLILTLACFFIPSIYNVNAQSLDSLIQEALQNNPQIKSLEFKIKSSMHKVGTVNTLPPPTVGLELSQMPFNSLNFWNEPISQNLTFSQMFILGGKLDAMSDVEKSNVIISQDNLEIYKTNLRANIKMVYFNLWMYTKKIEVQNESIYLLNQLLTSITNLYEINKISQADIFTVKSELAFNETQLLILNNQLESEIYKINKLLGRNLDSKNISISKDISIVPFNISQEELEAQLNAKNATLKKMNSMIDMTKLDITANKKDLIPDLMLSGMLMRMPKGMLLTANSKLNINEPMTGSDYGYSLMASFTIPFAPWSKGKIENREQELQTGIQSIELEKNDMQREMITQLKSAYMKLKTAWELIRLYSDKVIPLYRDAINAQLNSYQSNQININTVIDANRMLLMQTMNYYMAQADYQMAIAEIEMMVGNNENK